MKIVIDGENCIMGRLASFVAKQALQGKQIDILNSEKVFITGNRKDILEKYIKLRRKGKSQKMKGPLFPTMPEKILKRVIRGMMKYKEGRGKEAFKRIKCYIGIPKEFGNVEKISVFKLKENKKGLNLKELSCLLRGKKLD
ncbi:MAG: 50S ribosomal protein L13 [Candidatus Pacearchaeota archaeon]